MKKFLMTMIAVLLLASPTMAGVSDADRVMHGLSTQQMADLAAQAAQLKAENIKSGGKKAVATILDTTPEDVLKYANIGAGIGKALSATARELGIEVNNFAKTDVGKIAIFLIVWHLFGAMALHVILGIMFFTVGVSIWIWSFRRMCNRSLTTVTEHVDPESKKVLKTKKYEFNNNDPESRGNWALGHWAFLALISGTTFATMFSW